MPHLDTLQNTNETEISPSAGSQQILAGNNQHSPPSGREACWRLAAIPLKTSRFATILLKSHNPAEDGSGCAAPKGTDKLYRKSFDQISTKVRP